MQPVILYRIDEENRSELASARRHWDVVHDRTECGERLVVGRYSVLPWYEVLEQDLAERGCRLVNSHQQHRWIADFGYYEAFRDVTPESWSENEFADAPDGPFVLKGRSSSFKHLWSELMFAKDKADAARKAELLRDRQVIAQQGLLFRRYVPLESFGRTDSGLPIANEWRFFFVGERLIARGFYWARIAPDSVPPFDVEAEKLAREVAARIEGRATFFVVDVAKALDGRWLLIELNDGQTSGLAAIDPDEFHRELLDACLALR